MSKKITTIVFIILATLTVVVGSLVWIINLLHFDLATVFRYIAIFLFVLNAFISIAVCVFAIRNVLKDKKLMLNEFCLGGFLTAINVFYLDYIYILKNWSALGNIIANTCGILSLIFYFVCCILVTCVVAPKQPNHFLGVFFAYIPFLILGLASVSAIALSYISISFAVSFIILSALGMCLSIIAGARELKGKEYGFELNVTALLCEVLQFILYCTAVSEATYTYMILLCFCGIAAIIAGGVLISQSVEFGFILTAFGIIAVLVWIFILNLLLNTTNTICAISMIVAILLYMSNAIKMHQKTIEQKF
jgi:hypothetical protein